MPSSEPTATDLDSGANDPVLERNKPDPSTSFILKSEREMENHVTNAEKALVKTEQPSGAKDKPFGTTLVSSNDGDLTPSTTEQETDPTVTEPSDYTFSPISFSQILSEKNSSTGRLVKERSRISRASNHPSRSTKTLACERLRDSHNAGE